ncbi:hypothetical protein BFG60_0297 [Microcystis aeruginosa NIES-98]|nr:hypothetical protein BFG60_0297 [Microcystis aeruginosa NIES-98]
MAKASNTIVFISYNDDWFRQNIEVDFSGFSLFFPIKYLGVFFLGLYYRP